MARGSPDWSPKIVSSASGSEQKKQSVTNTASTVTFDQQVLSFLIFNDGTNAVHIKRGSSVDTNAFKLPSNAWFSSDVPTQNISLICASGETATCYLIGIF